MVRSTKRQTDQQSAKAGDRIAAALRKNAGTEPKWQMVGRFHTLNAAEALVDELTARGIESSVSLIGGLSVIAKG